MTIPSKTRAYTPVLNQRISYVSLNDLVASYGYGVKNALVGTAAFTLKYTCDGTTGPTSSSDHTDRLASKANFTTRGANAASAQAFFVVTDANGADWMFTYQGGTDDVGRWSYSASGAYVPAGTATHQPTATDEVVIWSASVVGNTTSADRVWHAMVSTDKKAMYLFVARSGVCVGAMIMIGSCTSAVSGAGNTFSPAMVGLATSSFVPAAYFNGSWTAGYSRGVWSSVGITSTLIMGYETPPTSAFLDGTNPAAQGAAGGLIFPLSVWSTTTSANGKIANLIDVYKDGNSKADGDLTTDSEWIHLTSTGSASAGVLWPWDGSTTPQMS